MGTLTPNADARQHPRQHLTFSQRHIYTALVKLQRRRKAQLLRLSLRFIADRSGVHFTTVSRALKALQEAGLINVDRQDHLLGRPNLIEVLSFSECNKRQIQEVRGEEESLQKETLPLLHSGNTVQRDAWTRGYHNKSGLYIHLYLKGHPYATAKEIARDLGLSLSTVYRRLGKFLRHGAVHRVRPLGVRAWTWAWETVCRAAEFVLRSRWAKRFRRHWIDRRIFRQRSEAWRQRRRVRAVDISGFVEAA